MKHKSVRPTSVSFMGRTYGITYDYDLPDELLGLTNHSTLQVAIRESQEPLDEADTLVHELMHILWYQMGLVADLNEDLEERVIRAMATAITYAIRENPQLLNYLKVALKKPGGK